MKSGPATISINIFGFKLKNDSLPKDFLKPYQISKLSSIKESKSENYKKNYQNMFVSWIYDKSFRKILNS